MILTLVLLSIGALLFLVIAYNVVQQYRQQMESERRATVTRYRAIADETEELLLNASQLPFSKTIILLLQHRILDAYRTIAQVAPEHTQISQRIADAQQQIDSVQENYLAPEAGSFRAPETDRQAVRMLQTVKRMRAVLRLEHNKGRIDLQGFAIEDRRLELILLKINIANLLQRAREATLSRLFGTSRQLLTKGISVLGGIQDKDAYLLRCEEEMRQSLADLDDQMRKESQQELETIKERESNDIDALFQPKKKW